MWWLPRHHCERARVRDRLRPRGRGRGRVRPPRGRDRGRSSHHGCVRVRGRVRARGHGHAPRRDRGTAHDRGRANAEPDRCGFASRAHQLRCGRGASSAAACTVHWTSASTLRAEGVHRAQSWSGWHSNAPVATWRTIVLRSLFSSHTDTTNGHRHPDTHDSGVCARLSPA
eukprot:7390088-Prymnesium_polylepis.1